MSSSFFSRAPAKSRTPKFDKARVVMFDPIGGSQLAKWILNRAEKYFGSAITPPAIELLQNSVGNDLSQLNVELEKLASYSNGKPIDEAAVGAVVGVRREESLPALLDAVAARDAAAALRILPGLLEQPKSSGVFIVMVLGMQVLGTGFARSRLAKRVPPVRIDNELMTMIKESGGFPGRSWKDAVNAWIRTAPKWSDADLFAAAATLHAADRALKDTGRTTEEGILQTAILAMSIGERSWRSRMKVAFISLCVAATIASTASGQATATSPVDQAIARAQQRAVAGDSVAARTVLDSLLGTKLESVTQRAEVAWWLMRYAPTPNERERGLTTFVVDYPFSPHIASALFELGTLELAHSDRERAAIHLSRFLASSASRLQSHQRVVDPRTSAVRPRRRPARLRRAALGARRHSRHGDRASQSIRLRRVVVPWRRHECRGAGRYHADSRAAAVHRRLHRAGGGV